MAEFNGSPRGEGRRLVVVASRFNEGITMPLAEGAVAALVGQGVKFEDIDVLWVPGAWEIPVAVRRALATERYDAAVAIGAVVRGDTPHFGFLQLTNRKQRLRQLHLRQAVQKITLVFAVVQALEQFKSTTAFANSRVVPGRDVLCT